LPDDPNDAPKHAALLITDPATAVPVIAGVGDVPFVVWNGIWHLSRSIGRSPMRLRPEHATAQVEF
jgi:hypothetical protein